MSEVLTEEEVNVILEDKTKPWKYGKHADGKTYMGKWDDDHNGFQFDVSLLPEDNPMRRKVEALVATGVHN
jgi:hypothetical protein